MARALLVALWCATATTATAARYDDYSGARMPQYGGAEYDARESAHPREPDDYRGHSPDAPAALDYKYEEELAGALAGKSIPPPLKEEKKEIEESESWQRPTRRPKRRKSSRAAEEAAPDPRDRFDPQDDFPNPKTSNRFFTKHRPRLKSRRYETDDDLDKYPSHRDARDDTQGYPQSLRGKHDDVALENEEPREIDDYHDKRNSLDDNSRSGRGERVARRRPREKIDRGPERGSDRGSDRMSEPGSDRMSDRENAERDRAESDIDRWMLMRDGLGRAPGPLDSFSEEDENRERLRRPDINMKGPPLPTPDIDADIKIGHKSGRRKGQKTKNYGDYNDYYDMKRVMNIKNKLPTLLRRNTVREEITVPGRFFATTPVPESLPESPGPPHSLRELLSNSRRFLPSPRTTLTTADASSLPAVRPTVATDFVPLVKPTTTTTAAPIIIPKEIKNATELSLAEKSRLSILKKAMRKESVEGRSSTKKPPVLLQVTMKMPTVVMVEPPSSEPFLRAREIYADSPARLDKVKRLMRHKLVANAKNIHDLTDNWDDLVCDYIDMSLLENISAGGRMTSCGVGIFMAALVIICINKVPIDI